MKLTLQEIANLIDGSIDGDFSKEIFGINSLENADSNEISYIITEKYKERLINSSAGAIIVNEKIKEHCKSNAIVVKELKSYTIALSTQLYVLPIPVFL